MSTTEPVKKVSSTYTITVSLLCWLGTSRASPSWSKSSTSIHVLYLDQQQGAHWIPLSPALLLFRGGDYFGPVKPCTFAIKPFSQVRRHLFLTTHVRFQEDDMLVSHHSLVVRSSLRVSRFLCCIPDSVCQQRPFCHCRHISDCNNRRTAQQVIDTAAGEG